jgi:hypothetical protein
MRAGSLGWAALTGPIDFPDPSFGDITPGLTDADWCDVFGRLDEDWQAGRRRGGSPVGAGSR